MNDLGVISAVLLSAVVHAIWNAQVKTSADRFATLCTIRVVGVALGATIALFVPLPKQESWPWLLGAAALHYTYYVCMVQAYRLGDFSQVYPIARGSAPLIVALLTLAFASEPLPPITLMAIGLMSTGIVLLSGSGSSVKAVAAALGMGISIALYSYFSGRGIRLAGERLSYMAWLELLSGIGLVAMALTTHRARVAAYWRASFLQAIAAGVLSVGGYMIALWAMTNATIAGVVALRETSALFGALIGAYVLKEGFADNRIIAAALVVAGVILLTLSS